MSRTTIANYLNILTETFIAHVVTSDIDRPYQGYADSHLLEFYRFSVMPAENKAGNKWWWASSVLRLGKERHWMPITFEWPALFRAGMTTT